MSSNHITPSIYKLKVIRGMCLSHTFARMCVLEIVVCSCKFVGDEMERKSFGFRVQVINLTKKKFFLILINV